MMTALIILALILLNGVFVAAEFAFLGAPRATLEQMALAGNLSAKRISEIMKTPRLQDRYIATAQLGVTFATLGLGMYGEHALAEWLHEQLSAFGWASWLVSHGAASIGAVAFLTYLHIVLGEMVPKALSLQYATKLCLLMILPMRVLELSLYPIVATMNCLGNFLLRLIGVDRSQARSHYHTEEELQYIIEESHEKGVLSEESGRIIDGIFDLDELYVHQVLTPRVRIDAIPEHADAEMIRDIVSRTGRTRYPVYRGDLDHVIGMVHARDLFMLMVQGKSLDSSYLHPIPKVPKTIIFEQVVEIMKSGNARMAIIMDEYGGTSGLLTMTDVFSEVMGWERGRIRTDSDLAPEAVGFACDVSGLARIEELAEVMHQDLEYEGIDTVGGLILDRLQAPAQKDSVVRADGLEYTVTKIKNGGVERCRVVRLASLDKDDSEEESD